MKKTIAEIEATSWRLRECIRVPELTSIHLIGQMRRLWMLEEQKAWKREASFDYNETTAEMNTLRSRTNPVSEPVCYSKMLFNPGWATYS